jgi:hypothetical protein
MKQKYLFILTLMLFSTLAHAQRGGVSLNVKGGKNAVTGYFGAFSVEGFHSLEKNFSVKGGVQCTTNGNFAVEAHPSYFYDFASLRLHVEALLHYAPQSTFHNIAVGVGLGFRARYIHMTLGYYHRTIKSGNDRLDEPFNIYYELGVNCLPSIARWDLVLSISNSRLFELERHYQPSFGIDGWWYPSERIGVTLGLSYKPAGMFNITSEFNQLYSNLGVCCRW